MESKKYELRRPVFAAIPSFTIMFGDICSFRLWVSAYKPPHHNEEYCVELCNVVCEDKTGHTSVIAQVCADGIAVDSQDEYIYSKLESV